MDWSSALVDTLALVARLRLAMPQAMKLRFTSLLSRAPSVDGRNGVSRITAWPNGVWSRAGGNALLGAITFVVFSEVLSPQKVEASIIFEENALASLQTGRVMAAQDKVRQVQFTIVGGSIDRVDGTAIALGKWYTGLARHYFDYVIGASGSSNFSIQVATGEARDSRIQTVAIANVIDVPGFDFVILQHANEMLGASLPVFGTIAKNEQATFVGFGHKYRFFRQGFVDDGLPSAFNMTVGRTGSTEYFVDSSGSSGIPGGGAQFDSTAPGYNEAGLASLILTAGFLNPNAGFATGRAIPIVESGLATEIYRLTPLNNIPEPGAVVYLLAVCAGYLSRKRFRTLPPCR